MQSVFASDSYPVRVVLGDVMVGRDRKGFRENVGRVDMPGNAESRGRKESQGRKESRVRRVKPEPQE